MDATAFGKRGWNNAIGINPDVQDSRCRHLGDTPSEQTAYQPRRNPFLLNQKEMKVATSIRMTHQGCNLCMNSAIFAFFAWLICSPERAGGRGRQARSSQTGGISVHFET